MGLQEIRKNKLPIQPIVDLIFYQIRDNQHYRDVIDRFFLQVSNH